MNLVIMKKGIILFFAMLLMANYLPAQKYGYRFQSEFIELHPTRDAVTLIQTHSGESLALAAKKDNGESVCQRISPDMYVVNNIMDIKSTDAYTSIKFSDSHGNKVFILPTICVSMMEGHSIDPILKKYRDILTLGDTLLSIYYLPCKLRTAEEVLQIVSEIDKMEGVEWCQPDIFGKCEPAYSPHFLDQWHLKSTLNQNYAINAIPTWSIVDIPSYLKVAVIDDGVDKNHESFGDCVLDGYTVDNPNGKGAPQNWSGDFPKAHGTFCAGLIAANNDSIGTMGVAPGVKILPINIYPNYGYGTFEGGVSGIKIKDAIKWAVDHGADILNCSWMLSSNDNNVTAAIQYALQSGRSGKGCVVVAAAGNKYPNQSGIAFPSSIDGVISVGATNSSGILCTNSQRGVGLIL